MRLVGRHSIPRPLRVLHAARQLYPLHKEAQAIQAKPDFPKGYYRRGSAYLALGRPKDALRDFTQLCKLAPSDKDPTPTGPHPRSSECTPAQPFPAPRAESQESAYALQTRCESVVSAWDRARRMRKDELFQLRPQPHEWRYCNLVGQGAVTDRLDLRLCRLEQRCERNLRGNRCAWRKL